MLPVAWGHREAIEHQDKAKEGHEEHGRKPGILPDVGKAHRGDRQAEGQRGESRKAVAGVSR